MCCTYALTRPTCLCLALACMPIGLWGYEPGLKEPLHLKPDTNLFAIKYFNDSYRHMGQMAQWTGLMVYDTDPV
jgi:hypothetical protein